MFTPNETIAPAGLLIDTHCHLDDESFAEDLDQVLAESIRAGVRGWINVGFEPTRWASTVALAKRTPGMSIMLGVHPSSAGAWSVDTRSALRQQIEETGAVAIGEIGLDFFHPAPEPDVQRRAFIEQLDLALECDLPVVIHMRESEAEMLRLLIDRTTLPPLLFHSYDGGPELTDFILATGSFVGVGGLATRQKSDRLRAELQRIPLAQIVLETDAPYLIPARQRGRRNTPAQVRTVASFLANLTANDDETISTTTTRNAFTYFGKLRTA